MLSTAKSIHEKVSLELMEYISLGIYKPEDKLPSVRELSSTYHVNPNTIAKVYASLEAQGYIYSIPAKGYYVAQANEKVQVKTEAQMRDMFHVLFVLSRLAKISVNEVIVQLKEQFAKEEKQYDRSQTSD